MTGPEERSPRSAPRFDHVLYGLPGEVATISTDDEPRTGFLHTGKRKVAAGLVTALLLSGGAGGAYAIHERNLQQEADRDQELVEASSLDVALAAEIEEARAMLEERLDVAREVYAQSRDILASGQELRIELRTVIEDAEKLVRAEGAVAINELTEATEALTAAAEAVETAMDAEARAVLTDALTEARTVLTESEGRVADDTVRVQLAEIVERSEELLESRAASPQDRVDLAEELTAAVRLVADAVEAYEVERQATWEEPAVTPPVERETVPRRNTESGADSSERASPSPSPSDGGESESEQGDPATDESSSVPSPDPQRTESPTPTPSPSTQEPTPNEGDSGSDGHDDGVDDAGDDE